MGNIMIRDFSDMNNSMKMKGNDLCGMLICNIR